MLSPLLSVWLTVYVYERKNSILYVCICVHVYVYVWEKTSMSVCACILVCVCVCVRSRQLDSWFWLIAFMCRHCHSEPHQFQPLVQERERGCSPLPHLAITVVSAQIRWPRNSEAFLNAREQQLCTSTHLHCMDPATVFSILAPLHRKSRFFIYTFI